MNFESIYAQNDKCPVRNIGDGLVIMAPSGDTTHSLEDIGAFIWNQLDGKRTLQDVLDAVLTDYDIDEETAREDLVNFITQMLTAGLILDS
jgi:hypothetical protein